jgi:hypothetical protein
MDPRLRLAVDANVGWYEDIFALHRIGSRLQDGLWTSLGPPPPFHSDAVVVEPTVTAAQIEAALADRPRGGFKDSFGMVGSSVSGTRLLFAAEWIHWSHARGPAGPAPRAWHRVTDLAELARWNAGWDTQDVLLPRLLDRAHVAVLARVTTDGEIGAGAVARLGSGAVDLSNVHAVGAEGVDWSELRAAVTLLFPDRPIVGYERGSDLAAATAAGFEPVGDLAVWAR